MTALVLTINILEASVSDALRGIRFVPNALVGIFLLFLIPFELSYRSTLPELAKELCLFYFELPDRFIFAYCV